MAVEKEEAINTGLIVNASPETKILYFDIDGTFLDYDDAPKTALLDAKLEAVLKKANFDYLACVSGWVDIFGEEVMTLHSLDQRKEAIYQLLEPLFPDKDWFLGKLILISDTDARCSYIDLNTNWFYVDDWADKFFVEAWGERSYQAQLGQRILMCDHKGDGIDILEWLSEEAVEDSE